MPRINFPVELQLPVLCRIEAERLWSRIIVAENSTVEYGCNSPVGIVVDKVHGVDKGKLRRRVNDQEPQKTFLYQIRVPRVCLNISLLFLERNNRYMGFSKEYSSVVAQVHRKAVD